MNLPIELQVPVDSHNGTLQRKIVIHAGLTALVGPNGSGKTHILRALKAPLKSYAAGKSIRFMSAGRIGMLEQYRSDYDGQRGGSPRYDLATYGSKTDVSRRHNTETLTGDFQTLAERPDILIKIQERLRKLFKRDILVEWDAGRLKISFARLNDRSQPYSSSREASGLLHLVGILSALYDDEVGILLLDEPEVSLHPQLQAFLLQEFLAVANPPAQGTIHKLIVIATHSTEMLQIAAPRDLPSIVFCYDLNTKPIQVPIDAPELQNKKLQTLLARLGQEHKLSLFSKRPLLVEGPSDVFICTALARKLTLSLEAAGSQLLPVLGKGQMPTVVKLMRLLGKQPVVLADADGFTDGTDLLNQFVCGNDSTEIDAQAASLGFQSAKNMANTIFNNFCQLVDSRWPEIEAHATAHPYWANQDIDGVVLAKRRSTFCALFCSTDNLLSSLSADGAWTRMRKQLGALLDLLEKAGLFFLRKGTIESYYSTPGGSANLGKPAAAVSEMEVIAQMGIVAARKAYGEIARCIACAANAEELDESGALRDLLLAIVAPAQARLKAGDRSSDFNTISRTILGERAKIFDLAEEGDSLVVSMASKILPADGFPIKIATDDDVVQVVSKALKPSP